MEHFPTREEMSHFGVRAQPKIKGELLVNEDAVLIKDLANVQQIASGLDHVLFLDDKGQVMAMGDDTFGQCGTGGEGRTMAAPFFEARHRKPVKV